jgi:hypothetical protein
VKIRSGKRVKLSFGIRTKKQVNLFFDFAVFEQGISGMVLLPFRFSTPFPRGAFRRLRNSLRSDILAARLGRVPSKGSSGRLNLRWSLRPSLIFPREIFVKREAE